MRSCRLPAWSRFCTHPHVDLRVKQLCLMVQNHKKLRAKAPRRRRSSHLQSLFWNFLTRVTQTLTVITRRQHASSACSVRTVKVQAEASYWGAFVTALMQRDLCVCVYTASGSTFKQLYPATFIWILFYILRLPAYFLLPCFALLFL